MILRLLLFLLLLASAGCDLAPSPLAFTARCSSWPEADRLFRQDPRWLGGDAAYSIDLGGARVLWLFGDSFIATNKERNRRGSIMVRNSIGVQQGRDPLTATMTFVWGTGSDAMPASYFSERGTGADAQWYWPLGGTRLADGPVIVFFSLHSRTPGEGLGFSTDGWAVARIVGVNAAPEEWGWSWLTPQSPRSDAVVGTAVAIDGEYAVALSVSDTAPQRGYLSRIPLARLAAGELPPLEWWDGVTWSSTSGDEAAPQVVLPDAGPEASLHHDPALGVWIHVASRGFGASTIVLRTAPRLTGPWSAPLNACTPPESRDRRPFVYGAKAHPSLGESGGPLVVTYVANSFRFGDLLTPNGSAQLYWPRFMRITLTRR